jgi:hypothetical protein
MASYKVPQDVEADDKLIGPFSFRQFIYLIIVAASIAIAWALGRVLLPLAVVPLPIILLFGALALPLRKDQPMETYLAAIISFYLKPRRRLWDPDGQDTLIEITAPKVVEVQRTKDLSQSEAERRLSYLADIVDTQGWAVRGVTGPVATPNSAMNTDVYFEAQQAEDILDSTGHTASMINDQLVQTNQRYRDELKARMQQPAAQTIAAPTPAPAQQATQPVVPPIPDPYTTLQPEPAADEPVIDLAIDPYPTMNQSVVQPLTPPASQPVASPQQPAQQAPTKAPEPPSANSVSPDIMNLANNSDLSIETIAHEAQRIKEKESLPEDEVVISLR